MGVLARILLLAAALLTMTIAGMAQSFTGFQTFYTFKGSPDGDSPRAGLTLDPTTGILYGATAAGGITAGNCGALGCGTIIQLTPPVTGSTWTEEVIYAFPGGPLGSSPFGTLVLSGGVLYGTVSGGGAFSKGAVFSLTPPAAAGQPWTEAVLYSFTGGSDGAFPHAGLALSANGVFYGTTAYGGVIANQCGAQNPPGCGTLFSLTPAVGGGWTFGLLHGFAGGNTDGANPFAAVVVSGNRLYGTTTLGGAANLGTVYQFNTGTAAESVIHSFTGSDGASPFGGVVIGPQGVLYGATSSGASGFGTIFKLTPPAPGGGTWGEIVLHAFLGPPSDGATPFASPLFDGANGTLYGTTVFGGASNNGTVYELKPPATSVTLLRSFSGGADERNPLAPLLLGKSQALYGATDPRQLFASPATSTVSGTAFAVCTRNPPHCKSNPIQ
jgi:uncharacterized repeat protein (TIGR03803 family)